MSDRSRPWWRMLFGAMALAVCGLVGLAPSYGQASGGHIRIILPYTAGSPNDVVVRLVAPSLAAELGQAVIVENRPGGGSTIGTSAAAKADPDGRTLLFANSINHVIAPFVSPSLSYDPLADFVPIAPVSQSSWVMVVVPTLPVHTLSEFVDYARSHPGELNFGYGQGTAPQLVGAMFKRETGVKIADISYKGGAQAVTDMLGGTIHMNFGTAATLLPFIKAGKLRALAVTSPTPSPDLPGVPTMGESGLPALTVGFWSGFLGPAKMPEALVVSVSQKINAIVQSPELRSHFAKLGFEPKAGTPEEFKEFLALEKAKWGPIAQQTGLKLE